MNICKRCGKENQEHYKFCLGCGGELTPAAPQKPGDAMAKTMMAEPSLAPPPKAAGQGRSPTPPGGIPVGGPTTVRDDKPPPMAPPGGYPGLQQGAPFMAPTPFSPGPPGGGAPPPGAPAPFVATAKTPGLGLNPTPFTPGTAQPGGPPPGAQPARPKASPGMPAPLGAVPPAQPMGGPPPGAQPMRSAPAGSPMPSNAVPQVAPLFPSGPMATPFAAAPAPSSRPCPNCGTEVPAAFAFCGACGTKLAPVAAEQVRSGDTADIARQPPIEVRPKGRLTLIRPDGSEGGVHDLKEGENKLGREHGPIFENDGYLSPTHAELIVNAAGAVVRDLDSLNGVFVKMLGEEELTNGQIFRIGQELMRFDTIGPPEPLEDGTEIMGSPNPGYWGRLSVMIGMELDGSAFPLFGDAVTIGRERGDINFPDDGYVSGLHARVLLRNGRTFLTDLGSSNGTFMRIDGERQLTDGSFVLLGQQLFRVTINP